MKPRFKTKIEGNFLKIFDEQSKYLLMISKRKLPDVMAYTEISFISDPKLKHGYVTCRGINETPEIEQYLKPENQLIDIGGGLHEASVALTKKQSNLGLNKLKPIVIDPFNYEVGIEMLEHSINYQNEFPNYINNKIDELIKRAYRIINPQKVKLINTTVENALKISELKEVADIVFSSYANIEKEKLNYFKKPEGEILYRR